MPVAYKNAGAALTTSAATVYTCPASTEAVVLMMQAANIDGSSAVDVTVRWGDSSDSNTEYHLASTVSVAADDSLSIISGPLHLEAGDYVEALASANSDAELTLSIMEIT